MDGLIDGLANAYSQFNFFFVQPEFKGKQTLNFHFLIIIKIDKNLLEKVLLFFKEKLYFSD